jgi:hypothetical protein
MANETEMAMIMVPEPAVWLAVLVIVGPVVYGLIWAAKDTARAIGRSRFGWRKDPPWDGVIRFASIFLGAALGSGMYYWLQPGDVVWGTGIGALAGLFNIGLFKIGQREVKKKVAQALIGAEAKRATDVLGRRGNMEDDPEGGSLNDPA